MLLEEIAPPLEITMLQRLINAGKKVLLYKVGLVINRISGEGGYYLMPVSKGGNQIEEVEIIGSQVVFKYFSGVTLNSTRTMLTTSFALEKHGSFWRFIIEPQNPAYDAWVEKHGKPQPKSF